MKYMFLKYDIMMLSIFPVSVVISRFLFLILLILVFSLCLLVTLDKGLSILLNVSKN